MFDRNPTFYTSKWTITKVIIACIALLMAVWQFYAGFMMLYQNNHIPDWIEPSQYSSLSVGQMVSGELTEVMLSYPSEDAYGTQIRYYMVRTPDDKLLGFVSLADSKIDYQLNQLENHEISSVQYRGKVHELKDTDKSAMGIFMMTDPRYTKSDLVGKAADTVLPYNVNITAIDTKVGTNYIVATFVGGVLMLLIVWACMHKLVKRLVYNIKVQRGIIEPTMVVKKENLNVDEEITFYSDADRPTTSFAGINPVDNPDYVPPTDPFGTDSDAPFDPNAPVSPDATVVTRPIITPNDSLYYSGPADDSGTSAPNTPPPPRRDYHTKW